MIIDKTKKYEFGVMLYWDEWLSMAEEGKPDEFYEGAQEKDYYVVMALDEEDALEQAMAQLDYETRGYPEGSEVEIAEWEIECREEKPDECREEKPDWKDQFKKYLHV